MRKLPLILPLLASSLVFGQTRPNSITVTASRNSSAATPDLAVFLVRVDAGLDTSLDDVIAALQGSGIGAANLQNVYTFFNTNSSPSGVTQTEILDWSFTFTAPFTKSKDTITMLTSLQAAMGKQNNGITMSFSIQGSQSSAQPQTCAAAELLTDARTQAQKIVNGAGGSVGNILAMSSPTGSACILTVKFALLK